MQNLTDSTGKLEIISDELRNFSKLLNDYTHNYQKWFCSNQDDDRNLDPRILESDSKELVKLKEEFSCLTSNPDPILFVEIGMYENTIIDRVRQAQNIYFKDEIVQNEIEKLEFVRQVLNSSNIPRLSSSGIHAFFEPLNQKLDMLNNLKALYLFNKNQPLTDHLNLLSFPEHYDSPIKVNDVVAIKRMFQIIRDRNLIHNSDKEIRNMLWLMFKLNSRKYKGAYGDSNRLPNLSFQSKEQDLASELQFIMWIIHNNFQKSGTKQELAIIFSLFFPISGMSVSRLKNILTDTTPPRTRIFSKSLLSAVLSNFNVSNN